MPRFLEKANNSPCGHDFDPKVKFFKAMACCQRIKILDLIKEDSLNVNEISEKLNVDKSVTSRHLTILHLANIITYSKKGLNVYYTVTDKSIYKILDNVSMFLKK